MSAPADDIEIGSLPALIDQTMRSLAEARDIGEVLQIRGKAEAFRAYAKKLNCAVEAQNGCAKIVALAEKRIGQELERLPKAPAGRKKSVANDDRLERSPTLAELGLTKTQSADYQRLALLEPEEISAIVEEANRQGKPVAKSTIMQAAAEKARQAAPPKPGKAAAAKGGKKPKGGGTPKLTLVERDDRTVDLTRLSLAWLAVCEIVEKYGHDAGALASLSTGRPTHFDPARTSRVAESLVALAAALGAAR